MTLKTGDIFFITLLSFGTLVVSLLWFPKLTPDSYHYLDIIEILRGNLSPRAAVPPFCYRPLMPWIVSLFPTDPIITWALLAVVLNTLSVPIIYVFIREFHVNRFGAFVGTGLSTINIVSIAYGSAVLTDVPAMLFLLISLFLIKRESRAPLIIIVLLIGTAFKEVVILGGVVWIFRALLKGNKHALFGGIIGTLTSAILYFSIRWTWALFGVQPDWYWKWNDLANFVNRPDEVIKTFWLGFMFWIPAMFVALLVLWRDYENMRPKFIWLLECSPLLLLLFAGLFMAYFSLRFLWPLYFAMAPAASYAAEWVWTHLVEITRPHIRCVLRMTH